MKRVLLISLLLFLFSCEKEGRNSNILVGKWQLTKIVTEQVAHSGTSTTTIPVENTFYLFNNEGTVKYFSKDGSVKEFVYSLDSDNMTLTMGSTTLPIKELTKTSLVYYTTTQFLDGTASPPAAGTTYTYNYLVKVN